MTDDGSLPAAPVTNREIESRAIAYVVRQEEAAGRTARDTREAGAAADVVSGDRTVEVKAFGTTARGMDLWLEVRQVEEAKRNPNFWLYVVENVRQGDSHQFRLLRIGGEALSSLLGRAVRREYFTVPWPVSVYDALFAEQSGENIEHERREP